MDLPLALPALLLLLVQLVRADGNDSTAATPRTPAGTLAASEAVASAPAELQWKQPPGLGLRALLWSNRGPIRHLAGVVRKAASRFIRGLSAELKEYGDDGSGPPAGRRKKDGWPLLAAGLIMGGTLLTIGLGALAAMAGKALMSAMLALGMSLMSAFRAPPRRCRRSDSGCGDDDSSRYEIIARPVITHGHTHSAVLHHDPAPAPMSAYPGYVRSLVQSGATEQVAASMSESSSSSSSSSSDIAEFARSGALRVPVSAMSGGSSGPASGSPYDSYQNDGWSGAVLGMKSPSSYSAGTGTDSVLNLTLGTWGQALGKHPLALTSSQPRALASPQASPLASLQANASDSSDQRNGVHEPRNIQNPRPQS